VPPTAPSRNESERVSKINQPPLGKAPTAAGKRSREIVLANKHPNYIDEIVKANTQRPIQTNLPEALETFNRQIRDKMTGQLGPASAEILRQGTEFVEKSDDHKAMVRFEDIRQLERRNKNYRAVGWALLEIGRIYIRRGDYLKAEEAIDNSLKIFSTVKAQDEKILALIELARLKRLEKSAEKSLRIFAQAREQADLLGRPTLSQGIQDMIDGSFDQRTNTTKPIEVQTKIQPEKGPVKEPAPLSKAQSPQTTKDDASKVSIISSKTGPKMSSDVVRSVFDTKPEKGSQREKESIQSSGSASSIDNKVTGKSTTRIDETKTGVESPTAKHPDTTKPISVVASSRPESKQVVSKKDREIHQRGSS
jgi:tetratricopeptide (TPR) repeat protein